MSNVKPYSQLASSNTSPSRSYRYSLVGFL